jgi:hypothetical protein
LKRETGWFSHSGGTVRFHRWTRRLRPSHVVAAREGHAPSWGNTSNAIGARLTISAQTVNTHIKSIFRKLDVRSRAQAVSCAASQGFL